MVKNELAWFEDLLRKYRKKPCICAYCGSPIPFKEFVNQYDQDFKFCDRRCFHKYQSSLKPIDKEFSSQTERLIFEFLTQNYSNEKIDHNINDLIPPYEIDFLFIEKHIVIEYNGTLHYTSKYGDKKSRKTKLNDRKKRNIICKDIHYKLIRIWSEVGLFTRMDLFDKVLVVLKDVIDYVMVENCFGKCNDIIVKSDGTIETVLMD